MNTEYLIIFSHKNVFYYKHNTFWNLKIKKVQDTTHPLFKELWIDNFFYKIFKVIKL